MKPNSTTSANSHWPQPLADAVEGLYRAFAHYPLKPHLDNCTHCHDERDNAILHATSLRNLTVEQLDEYSFCAMTTMGDGMDYRHFLPRILELSLTSKVIPGLEPWLITDKLVYVGFGFLPDSEHAAIAAFNRSLWAALLTRNPVDVHGFAIRESSLTEDSITWTAEDVFRMSSNYTGEFETLLASWRPEHDRFHLHHFAELVLQNGSYLGPNDLPFDMMQDPAARRRLKAWMLDQKKLEALEKAAYTDIESPWADACDRAAQEWRPHVGARPA